MKRNVTIVTEGQFDAEVLKKLLGERYDNRINYRILSANGYSSALSKVKSLISQMSYDSNIVLLLETDSTDPKEVAEKQDFVNTYIEMSKNKNHIKTVWAIPEFEIIFLTNDVFMRELAHDNVDKRLLDIGKNSPRKVLESISGLPRKGYLKFLENKEIAEEFFQTGVIKEISDFIEA